MVIMAKAWLLPRVMWAVYLMLAAVVAAIIWASVAQVDMVSRSEGRVVPDGKEQIIASLDSGLLRELPRRIELCRLSATKQTPHR